MAQGICELLWLELILEDLRIKCDKPTRLYYDSKFAISIAHNPIQHDRTKHIKVDKHFIKEKLDKFADFLTKRMNNNNIKRIGSKL